MSHSEDANADSEDKKPSSGLSNLFNNQDKPLNAFVITSRPPPLVSHHSDKESTCSSSSAYFTASLPNSLHNPDWSDQSDGLSRTSSVYDNQSDYEVILDDGSRQKRTVSLSTLKLTSSNQFLQNSSSVLDHWMLNTTRHKKKSSKSKENTGLLDNMPLSLSSSSDNEDDDYNDNNTPSKPYNQLYKQWTQFKKQHLNLSYKQKMVLKCSFAYMIGSLFTFVPVLNALCGTHIASHMAATVTVFFNPAKSVGGIIEAAGFGWLYTLVALALSLASMYTTGFFLQREMPLTASCVSVGVWLAGSTFVISYLKAKINTPSILIASGLAFIIIFTVIIRQGSGYQYELDFDVITETFSIVAIGTAISVLVCIFVWPMSASKKLRTNIDSSLSSTRVLLKLLTKTFLLDADLPEFAANKTLETALKSHTTCFTSLKPALKDAKLEFYNLEMRHHANGYDKIVESIERLAQHVGGLRSSCGLQVEVMQKASHHTKNYGAVPPSSLKEQQVNQTFNLKAGPQRKKMEHELKREREIGQHISYFNIICNNKKDHDVAEEPVINAEKKEGALVQFIRTVRSPMKSLAFTCKQTIIHLQARFMRKTTRTTPSFGLMRQNLANAIELFESSQHQALIRFYQRRFKKDITIKAESIHFLTSSDDIFLVYFFVFCLVEFAKELMTLVEAVQVVFETMEEVDKSTSVFAWTKFFMNRTASKNTTKDETDSHEIFIPNNHNTVNTLHTPAPKTKLRKFFLRLWGFFSKFKSYQVRFAFKSMVTAVFISVLAFIPATQTYFTEFKMEWTLITVMAVMTPTVGGTNLGAVLRIFATVLGCILAAVIYTLFHEYVVMLCLCTWLISIPSFWLILHHKHGRFGLFTLLAYNLVVLYKYKHRDDESVDVFELTWMRCVAVSLGVLIGLFVTAYIWPYEARTEVRKGLSDLLLRLSWLYKQLVAVYSEEDNSDIYLATADEIHVGASMKKLSVPIVDPSILTRQNKSRALGLQKIELSIQLGIFNLQSLLVNAPNEPRLKGPFPTKTYTAMLTSCQNILDNFLSLRIVILKDVWAIHIRHNFLLPASQEFMEMAGNVFLYFYLLASALQLKTPLPPYLPPAEKTRRLLMSRLQQLQVVMEGSIQSVELSEEKRDECYIVYYAYVVLMENIIRELDSLGGHMKDLFGSLVPEDQWARCFGQEIDLEQN
ncbi:Fusaric acid resistance protein-like-domain-containing protein [Thamnidium elegans]|nr:Fusaric acid resistance protein-like-domain-containing protein [Thamnidium elegans]